MSFDQLVSSAGQVLFSWTASQLRMHQILQGKKSERRKRDGERVWVCGAVRVREEQMRVCHRKEKEMKQRKMNPAPTVSINMA